MPKDWFEVWEDRKHGTHRFKMTADTTVVSLRPYINREVHYWPLLQSDQHRSDVFIREYQEFSRRDTIPDLTILSLPCDHSEGVDPKYPTPRAMMADNDLALGRVVEAVTASPQWKETLDLTPYRAVPSNIRLDERNPAGTAMNRDDRFWLEKTRELDWSHIDAPDPYWLNRIIWYSIHKGASPYPGRPGEQPGHAVDLD